MTRRVSMFGLLAVLLVGCDSPTPCEIGENSCGQFIEGLVCTSQTGGTCPPLRECSDQGVCERGLCGLMPNTCGRTLEGQLCVGSEATCDNGTCTQSGVCAPFTCASNPDTCGLFMGGEFCTGKNGGRCSQDEPCSDTGVCLTIATCETTVMSCGQTISGELCTQANGGHCEGGAQCSITGQCS